MNDRIHVVYSGKVQGVGFRYTAQSIANQLGVTGWVRNCRNGTVEVTAEGTEDTLQKFLTEVQDAFSSYIREAEVDWSGATREFTTFGVEF